MLGKFHEDDYDGIVLKIPAWFIRMNNLDGDIQSLFERLEQCNMGKFHPDHVSNLKELEEYKTKSDTIKEQKRISNEVSKARDEWERKCMAGEAFQLEWQNEKCLIDVNDTFLEVNGVKYDHEDIFAKRSVKAAFETEFKKHCCGSLKEFREFLAVNERHTYQMTNNIVGLTEETFDVHSISLYCSSQGFYQLGLSYRVLCVKHDYSIGTKNINCRRDKLLTYEDGSYGICMWHGWHTAKKLEGFTRSGLKLIKEEKK